MQRRNRRSDPPACNAPTINLASRVDRSDEPSVLQRKHSKSNIFRDFDSGSLRNSFTKKVTGMLDDFIHARTGPKGCFLTGVIRFCYASLYLYSMILLTIQMPRLFDPRKGLIPYSITSERIEDYEYNVYDIAPNSSLIVYLLFLLGLVSGFSLLLGIKPRLGAIGAFFFLRNLQNHNYLIFDAELRMNKMWAFFLMFLPLDHFTLEDDFGGVVPIVRKYLNKHHQSRPKPKPRNQSSSWPMWPFRLWQVYICLVYMGAGIGKLNSEPWTSGTALSWIWYDETIGRFYPAFVNDLLFNRMISIKVQTWMSLLIESLCFITIWPLKTRKITFVALVLLHIGIELAMVMHIFEYISILAWVSFFVYPNDGESNSETLIKSKKNDGARSSAGSVFGSKPFKIYEPAIALSLLYLLIFDAFPYAEVENLMPAPLVYFVWKFVYPPTFIKNKLGIFNEVVGINTGPYILFKGQPLHMQSRMTAVIRFKDGSLPLLDQQGEWSEDSFVKREINYWWDAYSYYLTAKPESSPADVPFYAALAVSIAELYSNGAIDRQYEDITFYPENVIETVSIKVHKRYGSDLPAPPGWGLFESIPREWTYSSECQYVFAPAPAFSGTIKLQDQELNDEMYSGWDALEDGNGCQNYNPFDEALHRRGQYGEPTPDDDATDDGASSVTGNDETTGPGDENGDQANLGYQEPNNDDGDDDRGAAREEEEEEENENEGDDETPPPQMRGGVDAGDDETPPPQIRGGVDAGDDEAPEGAEAQDGGNDDESNSRDGNEGEDETPPPQMRGVVDAESEGDDEPPVGPGGDSGDGEGPEGYDRDLFAKPNEQEENDDETGPGDASGEGEDNRDTFGMFDGGNDDEANNEENENRRRLLLRSRRVKKPE